MRNEQNIKGWLTTLAVIGAIAFVIPAMGTQSSHQLSQAKWTEQAKQFRASDIQTIDFTQFETPEPVSYTHLTLPTIYSV